MSHKVEGHDRPIENPRDRRLEHARAIEAQKEAQRLQKTQQESNSQVSQQVGESLKAADAQRIAGEGLVGSKRLAENLEGMLRDKPKFNFQEVRSEKAETEESDGEGDSGESKSGPSPSFTPFVPGERPLPLIDARPRTLRPAEDPNSPDLNLSQENRERALNQGTPASQTVRAAGEIFQKDESNLPPGQAKKLDNQPAQPVVVTVAAPKPEATAPAPAPAADATPAQTTPPPSTEVGTTAAEGSASTPAVSAGPSGGSVLTGAGDPALTRSAVNFDRSHISTTSETPGETRGTTDNQLVLDRSQPDRVQHTLSQEINRQSAAEDESQRRANSAQSAVDSAKGQERQLTGQRDELEQAKANQRRNAAESSAMVEADTAQLADQARQIQSVQQSGESSLNRINTLDSQVQEQSQLRDQANSDVTNSQQTVASLQNQVDSISRQPLPEAPKGEGKGKGKGNEQKAAEAQAAQAAQAQQQAALSAAQNQLTVAQKEQADAQRRQQEAESALQVSQAAASDERKTLEQLRGQLGQAQENRKATQDVAQLHRDHMQQDQDRVKDLTSHSQDLRTQFDEVAVAKERAQTSVDQNRANAAAARQNVEHLQGLSSEQASQESGKGASTSPAEGESSKPLTGVRTPSISDAEESNRPFEAGTNQAQANRGSGPSNQNQGNTTVVQLNSLNQGANQASQGRSASASKNRSGSGQGDDLGAASLAEAAAASNASSSNNASNSGGRELIASRGGGDDHEGPGNSDFGHSRGRGGKD